MMRKSFAHVGLSLNISGSEDHEMKFQGQPQGKTAGTQIKNVSFIFPYANLIKKINSECYLCPAEGTAMAQPRYS